MHFPLQFILASVPLVHASGFYSPPLQQPIVTHGATPEPNQILSTKVDAAINSILKDFKSPGGVGVAVIQKNKQGSWAVETKGYGTAKVDGTEVTSDTLFAIGSNSKLFNILATGLLISNESLSTRISWKTKIAAMLPEWRLMDPVATSESTIEDIMSHRTGLPRHDFIRYPSDSVPDSIRRLRHLRPSTGFRELWQYNNHMYTLLSYFPPFLTGIPFEQYVNEFIVAPLGMSSTTYFSDRAAKTGKLADGMARDGVNETEDVFGLGRVRALPYWAPSTESAPHVIAGAGGVISNANDMATWLQTLLNQGRHPITDRIIIPSDVLAQVGTGLTVAAPVAAFPELSPVVYGGAQSRGTYRGFEFIEASHGGSTAGFKSQVIRIPDHNLGVAIMSNDESFGDHIAETIKFRILDEALKLEVIDWAARFKSLITADFNGRTIPTPRKKNATLPSLPFTALVGRYSDPGYGDLDLCLVSSGSESSGSESCDKLIQEIPAKLPHTINLRIPTLLARWETLGLSYVSLVHFEGNLFNVSGLSSIATGNSSDAPFWVKVAMNPSFVAEFSYDGNLGIGFRGFWGAGEGVQSPRGDTVKERAEVWFEKS